MDVRGRPRKGTDMNQAKDRCLKCGEADAPPKPVDYNHLILYAKGHYRRGDVIEDVKRILMARTWNDNCSDGDMWSMCASFLLKYTPSEHRTDEFAVRQRTATAAMANFPASFDPDYGHGRNGIDRCSSDSCNDETVANVLFERIGRNRSRRDD